MSTSGDRTFVINMLKPRKFDIKSTYRSRKIEPKSILKKYARKSSTQSFGLIYNKHIKVHTLKDYSTLSYRLFTKEQERLRRKQNLSINLIDKYKIIYTDLRKRLYIEEPSNDVRAVTDIDKDYFTTLVEKPHAKYIPLYKTLKSLYSQSLRMRQDIGYRHDAVLNITDANRRELETYNDNFQRYRNQVKCFDRFVAEDYKKSMMYLKNCDRIERKVRSKTYELENWAMDKFIMMSRLIGLDYSYGKQQKYGRFLYYLSPPSWRAKHREFAQSIEIEAKGFDFSSSEEDTFNVIYERMQHECISGLVNPPLYFTNPQQLLDIFNAIEQQQLHHFSYVTYLAPYAKMLKKGIQALKQDISKESAVLRHMVERFKGNLEYYEDRESKLQAKFMKILNGVFCDTICAPEVLKLGLHLGFCYEKVKNDKPNFMDIVSIAKALESNYMLYCYKLDAIHDDEVKIATKKCLEEEKRNIKNAKVALKELRSFRRLERELLLAFRPITSNQIATLPPIQKKMAFSKIKKDKKKMSVFKPKVSSPYEPTEAEVEYLTLFTDWTEGDDPADFLQSAHYTSPKSD